ncbi:hypothetical protein HK102_005615 [Quaeritorhiza haematococci]|nr:hypothetical protein HK102_005615 [Quaeritorhiza haematococci]
MRLAIIALFLAAAGVNAFAVPHGGHRQHGQVGKYSGHRQHGQWSQRQQFHKREDAASEVAIASDNGTDEFTTEAHGMHGQSGKIIRRPGHGFHGQQGFHGQRGHGQQFHHFQKREDAEVASGIESGDDDFITEVHGMHGQSGKVIRRPGNGFHGQRHGQFGQHGQVHHFQKRDDGVETAAEDAASDDEFVTEGYKGGKGGKVHIMPIRHGQHGQHSQQRHFQKRDDRAESAVAEVETGDEEFTTESHGQRQRQWGKGGHRQHGQQRHFQKRDDGAESAIAEVETGDEEFTTESHGHRQRQWGKGNHRQHGQRIHRRGGGGGNRHKKEEKEHKKEQKKIEKKYKKGHH